MTTVSMGFVQSLKNPKFTPESAFIAVKELSGKRNKTAKHPTLNTREVILVAVEGSKKKLVAEKMVDKNGEVGYCICLE